MTVGQIAGQASTLQIAGQASTLNFEPRKARKFLGDLSADPTLGDSHRATLRSLIADIDRHYFTAGITNANTLDLEAIVTQWLTTANRAATPA